MSPKSPGCAGHRCPAHPDQHFRHSGHPRGHPDVTDIDVRHIRDIVLAIFDVPEVTRMCWTRCPVHPDQHFDISGYSRGHPDVTDIDVQHIRDIMQFGHF